MEKILMTPGPTNIPREIFDAMSVNMHHRTDKFKEIILQANTKLSTLFGSKNEVIPLLCSGTGGLEAAVINVFSPGDKLLAVNCGVFGKRFADIAKIYGVDVREKTIEWGYGITEAELKEELDREEYKAVYVTYSETSTGIKNDIKALGKIVKEYECLYIADIVSALGSLEFDADGFGVDVAIAGSQKGLMCPPGLSLLSVSDKAWNVIESSKLPKYYFDLKKYKNVGMPYTPGVSLILGLSKALDMLFDEGIDNVINRHKRYSEAVKHACSLMELKEFPNKSFSSEVLTAVYVPESVSGKSIIKEMDKNGIVITGGQGKLKDSIIRIGHMGYTTDEFVVRTIKALGDALNSQGYRNDTEKIISEMEALI